MIFLFTLYHIHLLNFIFIIINAIVPRKALVKFEQTTSDL